MTPDTLFSCKPARAPVVLRRLRGLLLSAALLALFFAPQTFARDLSHDGRAHDEPARGDAMLIGTIGEPSNMIPLLASDSASSEVSGSLYVAPLKYDKNLEVAPWAAERFEVLDDGRLLRFTLRRGILWEDGVELTAEDVEFTHKKMLDPETPTAYAGDHKAVKAFRRTGRYSFEVEYEHPFPRSFSTWMSGIWPRHALEGQNLRTTPLIRKPLSCGPYRLAEWAAGSKLTLTANPDYFLGEPNVTRRIFRVIPDVTTMFLELKAGKLDLMGSLTGLQYRYQAQTEEFKQEYDTYRTLASAYTYMGYNLKSPLFSDARVRVALAHALNKGDIIKGALLGQGEPITGPYRPDSWAYNATIEDYPHDSQKALALLAEAGWTRGADGILRKDGVPFAFTLLTNQGNEQRIKTAVIIQSQLRNIGIEVKVRTVEWAAFLKQFVMPGYFDAIILGWTLPQDPDGYDVWHSSRRDGGLNFIGYADDEADACLEAARSTLDRAARKTQYDRFQRILHRDQPYCFLYVPYQLSAVQKRFRGIDPAPAGIFYNSEEWWVPLGDQRYRISPQ